MLENGEMTEGQQNYFAEDVVHQEGNDAPVVGKQAAIDRLAKLRETLGIVGFISDEVGSVAVAGDGSFYDAVLNVKLRPATRSASSRSSEASGRTGRSRANATTR